MRNLAFVLWALGLPLFHELHLYMVHIGAESPTDLEAHLGTILTFIIWVVVGYLLYEKEPKSVSSTTIIINNGPPIKEPPVLDKD